MKKKQLEKKVEYLEKRLMINEQIMTLAFQRIASTLASGCLLDEDALNNLWKEYSKATALLCDNYDEHGKVYIAKGPSK